jgi:hypothetical protein
MTVREFYNGTMLEDDGKGNWIRWIRVHPAGVTVPQWIEGNAKGTMKRVNGEIYVKIKDSQDEWARSTPR